jgi:glycosyltransferase involved in cell wall biosynthesis
MLLVDDGSWDSSSRIAREYAVKHEGRLRYLEHPHHQNLGMSTSRNLGIHNARGEFIAILDSDDVWFPSRLEDQVALMKQHPEAAMVCGASEYWYSWDDPELKSQDRIIPVGCPQDQLVARPKILRHLYPLGEGSAPCPSSLLLRKSILQKVGFFQDSFPNAYEDQACLVKIYLEAPVFVSSKCWDRYRQHPNSCTSQVNTDQYHQVREYFLRWFERYLSLTRKSDPDVRTLLRRALRPYRWPNRKIAAMKRLLINAAKRLLPEKIYLFLRNRFRAPADPRHS